MKKFSFKLILCMALLTIFIGLGGFCYQIWHDFHHVRLSVPTQSIFIPKGASLSSIANALQHHGAIGSAKKFYYVVRLKRLMAAYGRKRMQIQAGEYAFDKGSSNQDVLLKMIRGQTVQHRVTVVEGLTSVEILNLLNQAPYIKGSCPTHVPEGALLPQTYFYSYQDRCPHILQRMKVAMQNLLNQLWQTRQTDLPIVSPEQALILASIVEKETALAHERSHVAAVFLNRLKIKMPLQSDPTVLYGIIEPAGIPKGVIVTADLKRQHAYNTYVIQGLPPGPICNPGQEAIKAVLNPKQTSDLYFVANGQGGHIFSSNLKEHQRHHNNWRALQKKLKNIKKGAMH